MGKITTRILLNRCVYNPQVFAQVPGHLLQVVVPRPDEGISKALGGFDNVLTGGDAPCGQYGGFYAASGGCPEVKGMGGGTGIYGKAAPSLGGGQSEGCRHLLHAQLHQFTCPGSAAKEHKLEWVKPLA